MAKVTDVQIDQLLVRLHELKQELTEEQHALEHQAKPVALDQQAFGRVSRGDALQQQQMAQAALRQCNQRLLEVDSALQRAVDNEFGLCLCCDQAIAAGRLKARPESAYCVDCQQLRGG